MIKYADILRFCMAIGDELSANIDPASSTADDGDGHMAEGLLPDAMQFIHNLIIGLTTRWALLVARRDRRETLGDGREGSR